MQLAVDINEAKQGNTLKEINDAMKMGRVPYNYQ